MCGSEVLLTHINTMKNLHSHHHRFAHSSLSNVITVIFYYRAPLTNNQEVSAYGNDGAGDAMDVWEVICGGNNPVSPEQHPGHRPSLINFAFKGRLYPIKQPLIRVYSQWRRDSAVKLKHKGTQKYLAASGQQFNRPISGQMEIVAQSKSGGATEWKVAEGVFVSPPTQSGHDEL